MKMLQLGKQRGSFVRSPYAFKDDGLFCITLGSYLGWSTKMEYVILSKKNRICHICRFSSNLVTWIPLIGGYLIETILEWWICIYVDFSG